ncbi:MAG: nicotinate-nucleotide adenylyltransferase [Chloroflexi bacterium]|nr:nicotinate-nucleotide adenylyltransferase [Chloroflexota bacterium]
MGRYQRFEASRRTRRRQGVRGRRAARDARVRLGVLGGSFDPIHLGHLILGETAREQLSLDKVMFIPAGNQWRKEGRGVAAAEYRLAMVRLAVDGNSAFEVSTMEIDRDGPTYTVETLAQLHAESPGIEISFIVGVDALADMPHWKEPRRIFELAMVCVAARVGEAVEDDRVTRIEMPEVNISSSVVRERVKEGKSIRYLVPDAVERYVREHGLYGG